MGRELNPKLAKYQELTKIVREASSEKGIGPVSKATKKVFEEAKKEHPNKDFMAQVDAAKALFKANSKKYL
jgi:phage terminase small subunit